MARRGWSISLPPMRMPSRAERAAKERADAEARGSKPEEIWVATDRESNLDVELCPVRYDQSGPKWVRHWQDPEPVQQALKSPFLRNIRRVNKAGDIVL